MVVVCCCCQPHPPKLSTAEFKFIDNFHKVDAIPNLQPLLEALNELMEQPYATLFNEKVEKKVSERSEAIGNEMK